MNQGQMGQQIQHVLQRVRWPVGAQDVVFGAQKGPVIVLAGRPTQQNFPTVFPCCIILLSDGDPDEDEPSLIEHSFRLITGVLAPGDPRGEHAMIGGPTRDLGKSPNRGIAEVTARVRVAVGDLNGADGAPIQLRATAIDTPFSDGRLSHIVFDEHTLTALCTSDLSYSPPQEFREVDGLWTWAGGDGGTDAAAGEGHCAGRFDFLTYVIRRVSAPLFPQAPTEGSAVYTGTAATHTETPIVGQNYGIFALYDPRKKGAPEGNSDPEVVGSTLER